MANLLENRKKFRKMKFKFEHIMGQSNVYHKQEQDAAETARRLAVENESVTTSLVKDRLLIPSQ
jgi:hypothetical protein